MPDWGFYETILCKLHLGSLLKDKRKVIKLIIRNWITEIMINQNTFFENHEVCEGKVYQGTSISARL